LIQASANPNFEKAGIFLKMERALFFPNKQDTKANNYGRPDNHPMINMQHTFSIR